MKKTHEDLDREAIDLANSAGERRREEQIYMDARYHWQAAKKEKFQKARGRFLKALAAMELCVLGVLLSVAGLVAGWVSPVAAVLLGIVFAAGGGTMGRKLREGQWYGSK